MAIALLAVLVVIAFACRRIATAVSRIDAHNRRFAPPEPEPDMTLTEGTVLILKAPLGPLNVVVTGFETTPEGALACVVEVA